MHFLKSDVYLQVSTIIKALHKQLREKSMKSRQGCFSILTEIALVLPGSLGEHIPALIPGKLLVYLKCVVHYSLRKVHVI